MIIAIATNGCTNAQEPKFDVAEEAVEHFLNVQDARAKEVNLEISNLETEVKEAGLSRMLEDQRSLMFELMDTRELEARKLVAQKYSLQIEKVNNLINSNSKRTEKLASFYFETGKNKQASELLVDWKINLQHPSSPGFDKQEFIDYTILYAKWNNYELRPEHSKNILTEAIQFAPDQAELHKLLGDTLLKLQHPKLARESFAAAIRLEPQNVDYYLARALGGVGSTEVEERELLRKDLEAARKIEPTNYRIDFAFAMNAYANDEWDECQKYVEQCLRNKPTEERNLIRILQTRLEILFKKSQFEEAISLGQLLLKVDDKHRLSATIMARSLAKLERFDEAENAYEVAIANSGIFDSPEEMYYERGLVYKKVGKVEKMLKDFKEAKSINQEIASKVDGKIRNAEQVIRMTSLEEAIKETPSAPENYIERAIEFRKLKQYVESVADIEKAITLDSTNSGFHYQLGLSKSWLDHEQAIVAYSKAIELDDQNWMAYTERANSFRWTHKLDKALIDCTHVIDSLTDNKDPDLYETVQTAYLYRGHVNRLLQRNALTDYQAGRKAPGGLDRIISPWIHDFRAKEHCGILEFELPIEVDPTDIDVRLTRTKKILRFLEYDIQRRANSGEYEGYKTGMPRRWANEDLNVVLRQQPEHKAALQLKKLLQENEAESTRLGSRVITPDDTYLFMKSIEDNWRRNQGLRPRANK